MWQKKRSSNDEVSGSVTGSEWLLNSVEDLKNIINIISRTYKRCKNTYCVDCGRNWRRWGYEKSKGGEVSESNTNLHHKLVIYDGHVYHFIQTRPMICECGPTREGDVLGNEGPLGRS